MYAIQPAQLPHGGAPEVINLAPAADETFKKGRVLTRNASGEVAVHALDDAVTDIFGVAQSPATAGVAAGLGGKANVAKANSVQVFLGTLYHSSDADGSGSAGEVTVATTMIGDQYGLLVVDGDTYVDESDTTHVVVEITDVKTDLNIVLFKFLTSAIQGAASS